MTDRCAMARSRHPWAPRRRPDIWLTPPLACFVVGLYTVLAPFSAAWNVGRVAGFALFAAVALMRCRHDRKGRPGRRGPPSSRGLGMLFGLAGVLEARYTAS